VKAKALTKQLAKACLNVIGDQKNWLNVKNQHLQIQLKKSNMLTN